MAYSQLLLIVVSLTAVLAKGILRVNPETRRIIDDEGRERYFHGVNVVVKQFPWIPEGDVYPFNETDMQRLQKMGLNSLRLVHNLVHADDTDDMASCNGNMCGLELLHLTALHVVFSFQFNASWIFRSRACILIYCTRL